MTNLPNPLSTLWNRDRHGPLPLALLCLTAVTGLVDAVSVLDLGRVFVANMTGNVVFVGFALAGAPGFSLGASLAALAGFLVGAVGGGLLIRRLASDRALILRAGLGIEVILVATALVLVGLSGSRLGAAPRDLTAALLASSMGTQNAVARRLAVPDLTTTVLTMTLTGLGVDLHSADRRSAVGRRLLAVMTMFAGAVAGAELVLRGHATPALGVALSLLVVAGLVAVMAASRPGDWRTA